MIPPLFRLLAGNGGFRGRLQGPEDELVMLFAADLRQWTLEGKLRAVWTKLQPEAAWVADYRVEAARARARQAKARALGAIKGAADFVFTWSDGSGWIEVKAPKGRLSDEQKDWQQWCELTGVRHAVMRRSHEGRDILQEWGVLRI